MYVPLPLTVTVSVSTGVAPPLWNSVKVIVPVGLKPPASVAVSVKVTALCAQRDRGRDGSGGQPGTGGRHVYRFIARAAGHGEPLFESPS